MFAISITEARQLIIDVAYNNRSPLLLWGKPGVGKSSLVWQVAKELDASVCDIRLSQYDSVDLRGIPSVDDDDKTTVWNVPSTLPFKGNAKFAHLTDRPIFLFLDEIGSAAPAVQAPAYQLTLDRRIGEHELMDNVFIVAASNREGDKGVSHRMATPLANRFTHAELVEDVEASTLYAQAQGWPAVWSAFINFRKPLLSTFDPAKPDKAFATPRTWEKAMLYWADARMGLRSKQIAIAGTVGEGAAAEFFGFVEVWQQVAGYMPKILKNPTSVELPDQPGMTYAVVVSVSGAMSKATVADYHAFLCRLDPEYVILAWQLAMNRDKALQATPQFLDFAKRYKVIF